ncbi:class I SAM-dependent methyltransferase [Plantibacter sp. Mn2098]|uniref:class I SAM-dependent methyltransferase n=1 Tax=Plantibacter sp. Mn2098 TaxID=3395266 RepID=UPI003BD39804
MAQEHYFTPEPGSELKLRPISVTLAGVRRELHSANGIFSPDHVDTGTQVLLANVPTPPPAGDLLDIGCGWGPIALSLALASPDATVWAVDVNERALEITRLNAERLGLTNVNAVLPQDVPADVRFATIWSNPPIRIGKVALHELLLQWVPRLAADADAWLVVQRNLGSDSLHRWLQEELPADFTVTRDAIGKGFRVLKASRGAAE